MALNSYRNDHVSTLVPSFYGQNSYPANQQINVDIVLDASDSFKIEMHWNASKWTFLLERCFVGMCSCVCVLCIYWHWRKFPWRLRTFLTDIYLGLTLLQRTGEGHHFGNCWEEFTCQSLLTDLIQFTCRAGRKYNYFLGFGSSNFEVRIFSRALLDFNWFPFFLLRAVSKRYLFVQVQVLEVGMQ